MIANDDLGKDVDGKINSLYFATSQHSTWVTKEIHETIFTCPTHTQINEVYELYFWLSCI
jgi:hypothetical protein